MELKLYDTLTREKRVFTPIDPSRVRIYVCGPTVYDFAHIGNARPVIVFDVLFRLLRHLYGEKHVTYVRNVTDVDDKINARAAERGVSIRDLTEETYRNFKDDVAALGCLLPTIEPRATEYVQRTDNKVDMIKLIERLVGNENAYVEQDHVLFHVPSMPEYGQLSKRTLDEMIAGARVEVAPYKRNPMDFVLWKPSDERLTNYILPKWKSPCDITVPGRPGWHIECSAMSAALLGETFDIHGGGIDLLFPHHENEIAQSRCAFHTQFMANYWLHNGFLQVEGQKMSKSLGNFVTIRELVTGWHGKKWPGQIVRLAMLGTHYRQPMNWTEEMLQETEAIHQDWSNFCSQAPIDGQVGQAVIDALCDDLNTPKAITELHALRKSGDAGALRASLLFLGVGIVIQASIEITMRARIEARGEVISPEKIEAERKRIESLVRARDAARKAKDFKESDRIRDELAKMGVVLKDSKDGTTCEIAR